MQLADASVPIAASVSAESSNSARLGLGFFVSSGSRILRVLGTTVGVAIKNSLNASYKPINSR